MKKIKISELFDIQIGLIVSRKAVDFIERTNNSNYSKYNVLSLKSLTEDNTINMKYFTEIYTNAIMDKIYLTKENDVIVRLVNPLKSFVVTKELENIVVPSQFLKLTGKKDNNILSEYVSVYLNLFFNTKKNQKYREDTWLVNSIKQSTVSDMEIPIIDIKKQEEIINFYKLSKKEISLYKNLAGKKEQLNNKFLQNLIENN